MKFTLIICTYKRPTALLQLLQSVVLQSLYPNEILIIDGSPDEATKEMINDNDFKNLFYFNVLPEERGLTKQRNYGIARVSESSEVVCFLDDDTILKTTYFEEIIKTYSVFNDA